MFARLSRAQIKITGRKAVPEYKPQVAEQQLRNWTGRLSSLSTSPAAKMYVAQLSALMNYYNRQVADKTREIDWKDWQSKIITNGLVDKVKNSFEQLNKHEYELDRIFTDVFSRDSKAIEDINSEMTFHTVVWMDNYADYAGFLSEIDSISNLQDYTMLEKTDMFQGLSAIADQLNETHNYLPGSKDDVNLYVYMGIQFAWGKKFSGFYRHPADDFKGGRATKNTMGR